MISAALGDLADALAILTIVVINAGLGFLQEYRAERSMKALRSLSAPKATVIRDGQRERVEASLLVPGDLVLIEAGDRVPADLRLIEAFSCEIEEAVLTGESVPVHKDAAWTGKGTPPITEARNMAFMGTTVTRGKARGVTVATGKTTQIGEIATLLETANQEPTPLERRLNQLGGSLVAVCLLTVLVVFAAGVVQGFPVYRMFLVAVSLAVAAIPEGLPAVVTVALAAGVQRMSKRNAIIRKLPAVETLGCTTVVCSDKTGTLTTNEMTARRFWSKPLDLEITGSGFVPEGAFMTRSGRAVGSNDPVLGRALLVCALCNNAELAPAKRPASGRIRQKLGRPGRTYRTSGDPTEIALLVAAAKGGVLRESLARENQLIHEYPFESELRRMTAVIRHCGEFMALSKGAPDVIVARCNRVMAQDGPVSMTGPDRTAIARAAGEMGASALRVLALAYKPLPIRTWVGHQAEGMRESHVERDMVFVGLVGMLDPPRDEAREAVRVAKRAGIRTVMVTGDHPDTARAVARDLGLAGPEDGLLTGRELETMTDEDLSECMEKTAVFARVSPRHKTRIVRALKKAGHVVAMTGDGVNDAPAIKEADIGVAMGSTGTDVTRETSDMVLSDDNYATIVAAVEEGRGIYENIRKFIKYLLACNAGEIFVMLAATVAGLPLPLLPLQILWMNLVTDGLPAVALGLDPPPEGIMNRPPRSPKESMFAGGLTLEIFLRGFLIGGAALGAFVVSLGLAPGDLPVARTVAFTTLVVSQLLYASQCHSRSSPRSRNERVAITPASRHSRPGARLSGGTSNPYILAAITSSLAMQAAAVYVPVLARLFGTQGLSLGGVMLVLAFSAASSLGWDVVSQARRIVLRRVSLVKA